MDKLRVLSCGRRPLFPHSPLAWETIRGAHNVQAAGRWWPSASSKRCSLLQHSWSSSSSSSSSGSSDSSEAVRNRRIAAKLRAVKNQRFDRFPVASDGKGDFPQESKPRPPLLSSSLAPPTGGRKKQRQGRKGSKGGDSHKKLVSFFDEVDAILEEKLRRRRALGVSQKDVVFDPHADMELSMQYLRDGGFRANAAKPSLQTESQKETSAECSSSPSLSDMRLSDFLRSRDDAAAAAPIPERTPRLVGASGPAAAASPPSKNLEEDPTLKTTSIFDAFPTPSQQPENAYDAAKFDAFCTSMNPVYESFTSLKKVEHSEAVAKWLFRPEPLVAHHYGALQAAYDKQQDDEDDEHTIAQGEQLRQELQAQQQIFLQESQFSTEEYAMALRALTAMAGKCAKQARAAPLEVAWEKIKEAGMLLPQSSMNVFLYVFGTTSRSAGIGLGGLSSSSSSSFLSSILPPMPPTLSSTDTTTPTETPSIADLFFLPLSSIGGLDAEKTEQHAGTMPTAIQLDSQLGRGEELHEETEEAAVTILEEVILCHDLLYQPSEQSTSLRVKELVTRGDAHGAEALVTSFMALQDRDEDVRLRTFLPILRAYCEKGDMAAALTLFKTMRDTPSVVLEPENFVLLISSLAERGFYRSDAPPIEGALELGYAAPCGPALFDAMAQEMADETLEITSASARRLHNAFVSGFRGLPVAEGTREMHPLAAMVPNNHPAANDNHLIVSRVAVDAQTGTCPRSGAKLRLIELADDERAQLHSGLLNSANSQYRKKTPSRHDTMNYAAVQLSKFASWLDSREGEPFTTIVDGANVAYHMQNFDHGGFNFHQIQFMVDALEKMKEKPLVVIPYKYSMPKFNTNTGAGRTQKLSEAENQIRKGLLATDRLYVVPANCLDDFYWMLASVSDQTASRQGADLRVALHDELGRWPGTRPVLVTNDRMRDHMLQLLEPRLVRRWYSCHIINYNFTAFVGDECVDSHIVFSAADFFSREIQGNPSPVGTAWHFPVSDWDWNERFCVRVPETNL